MSQLPTNKKSASRFFSFWKNLSCSGLAFVWLSNFSVPGKDLAPPGPDQPWSPPGLDQYEHDLSQTNFGFTNDFSLVQIDPQKVYALPELIDIAERSNPQTRVAWERARQAAKAVGLSESAYYPYLAASASAGYQRQLAALDSVFPANAAEEQATLGLQWLLFDFGERKAAVAATREQLMAANVGFNAVHQQIVFAVTKSFYDLNTARQRVGVAESALQAAQTVSDAAHARFEQGFARKPDVLQAEQQNAQATYDLEAARGALSDAQVALFERMGIAPVDQLQVAEVEERRFKVDPDESLDDLVKQALAQRPDLVAQLASLRAREADVRKARAAYYPKVSFAASVGESKLDLSVYGSPYFGNSKPDYSVGVAIDLPIFDGFVRANRLKIAESALRSAESELTASRNAAMREVWKAYTDLRTALRKQDSADKLLAAAESAFDASLQAYQHGLGTYVDVANAQRNVTVARSTVVDTRSTVFVSTTALALSVGELAKPVPATNDPAK
jgi:outer membrane protein TolC